MGKGTGVTKRTGCWPRIAKSLVAVAVSSLGPPGLVAQAVSETLQCATGDPVGSLGITGISCDRCQFYTNGRVHRAVFWTEPTITDLNPDMAAASVLKRGDMLVAVDGQLITTREGSARFSALPATGEVTLRIRRDGRVRDIAVPVTAVCPTAKAAAAPVVAGRPLPPSAPTAIAETTVRSPTPPPLPKQPKTSKPAEPVVVAEPVPPAGVRELARAAELPPTPPSPDAMAPRAELGFAFTCSNCEYSTKDGGTWTFPEPPVVSDVTSVGIGASSGLQPGDRILEVDGADITKAPGARRFAAIRPGVHVRGTVERDGRRVTVSTVARRQGVVSTRAETVVRSDPANAPLRFAGTVGNTTVEVRGGRVNVTEAEGGSLVIIRTGDAEIRIRVPAGGARKPEAPEDPATHTSGGRR